MVALLHRLNETCHSIFIVYLFLIFVDDVLLTRRQIISEAHPREGARFGERSVKRLLKALWRTDITVSTCSSKTAGPPFRTMHHVQPITRTHNENRDHAPGCTSWELLKAHVRRRSFTRLFLGAQVVSRSRHTYLRLAEN